MLGKINQVFVKIKRLSDFWLFGSLIASISQRKERMPSKHQNVGSNPTGRTTKGLFAFFRSSRLFFFF